MKGIIKRRNFIGLLIVFVFAMNFTGCFSKREAVKPDKDPKKIVQDKDYTKDVKKEKGVLDGQVYLQGNVVVGTMIIDKKVSDSDAKKLAEKYAKDLKKTYKDMTVNVQAVKDGKNIANITIEKDK